MDTSLRPLTFVCNRITSDSFIVDNQTIVKLIIAGKQIKIFLKTFKYGKMLDSHLKDCF